MDEAFEWIFCFHYCQGPSLDQRCLERRTNDDLSSLCQHWPGGSIPHWTMVSPTLLCYLGSYVIIKHIKNVLKYLRRKVLRPVYVKTGLRQHLWNQLIMQVEV